MKLYRASHTSDKSPSPITRAAKWLNPFYVVGKVTTVALRIQTRIEFNERGKISKRELAYRRLIIERTVLQTTTQSALARY